MTKAKPKRPVGSLIADPTKTGRRSRWKWVRHEGEELRNIGIELDGSLYNPNGYPADVVRAAVLAADERQHKRRSEAAKEAAVTRRRRQVRQVYSAAQKIVAHYATGPRSRCFERVFGRPKSNPARL